MGVLDNNKGIALVTALMFTVITLVISMSLLYMVLMGTRTSGALKRYHTAIDATYGGTEIIVKDIVTAGFGFHDYSTSHSGADFTTYAMGSLASPSVSPCFRERLTLPKKQWSTACSSANLDPKLDTDVSFNLNATSGSPYKVYSKIVDTLERKFLVPDETTVTIAGNSDTSSIELDGGSTTSGGSEVSVPHYPYLYRIEVQGEKEQNPLEKANISVQYAY